MSRAIRRAGAPAQPVQPGIGLAFGTDAQPSRAIDHPGRSAGLQKNILRAILACQPNTTLGGLQLQLFAARHRQQLHILADVQIPGRPRLPVRPARPVALRQRSRSWAACQHGQRRQGKKQRVPVHGAHCRLALQAAPVTGGQQPSQYRASTLPGCTGSTNLICTACARRSKSTMRA